MLQNVEKEKERERQKEEKGDRERRERGEKREERERNHKHVLWSECVSPKYMLKPKLQDDGMRRWGPSGGD